MNQVIKYFKSFTDPQCPRCTRLLSTSVDVNFLVCKNYIDCKLFFILSKDLDLFKIEHDKYRLYCYTKLDKVSCYNGPDFLFQLDSIPDFDLMDPDLVIKKIKLYQVLS